MISTRTALKLINMGGIGCISSLLIFSVAWAQESFYFDQTLCGSYRFVFYIDQKIEKSELTYSLAPVEAPYFKEDYDSRCISTPLNEDKERSAESEKSNIEVDLWRILKSSWLLGLAGFIILLITLLSRRGREETQAVTYDSVIRLLRAHLNALPYPIELKSPLEEDSYFELREALVQKIPERVLKSSLELFKHLRGLSGKNPLYRALESIFRIDQTILNQQTPREFIAYLLIIISPRWAEYKPTGDVEEQLLRASDDLIGGELDINEFITDLSQMIGTAAPELAGLDERELALYIWSLSYRPLLDQGQSLKLSAPLIPSLRSELSANFRFIDTGSVIDWVSAPHLVLTQEGRIVFSSPGEAKLT